eukprot:7217199-Heterocapsa_arctica.AAC.1
MQTLLSLALPKDTVAKLFHLASGAIYYDALRRQSTIKFGGVEGICAARANCLHARCPRCFRIA